MEGTSPARYDSHFQSTGKDGEEFFFYVSALWSDGLKLCLIIRCSSKADTNCCRKRIWSDIKGQRQKFYMLILQSLIKGEWPAISSSFSEAHRWGESHQRWTEKRAARWRGLVGWLGTSTSCHVRTGTARPRRVHGRVIYSNTALRFHPQTAQCLGGPGVHTRAS